tara:strand:+ start:572 stop:1066 length:495 start_codon:yes stop_codon:yes gene_type:complete
MPFDNATIPADRVTLMTSVLSLVKLFDKAGIASDKASEAKSTACDEILVSFRAALKDCDIVPFLFWQDICNAAGYAYTRLDMATGKATKIKGEKPHNTLKNVASQIKRYYEKFGNLEAKSYTELRDCLKPEPKSAFNVVLEKLEKLSANEREIIRKGLNKAAES